MFFHYNHRLHHIGPVYHYLLQRLPKGMVAMYHSHMSEERKCDILARFLRNSDLKIVLCSSAFSMGRYL